MTFIRLPVPQRLPVEKKAQDKKKALHKYASKVKAESFKTNPNITLPTIQEVQASDGFAIYSMVNQLKMATKNNPQNLPAHIKDIQNQELVKIAHALGKEKDLIRGLSIVINEVPSSTTKFSSPVEIDALDLIHQLGGDDKLKTIYWDQSYPDFIREHAKKICEETKLAKKTSPPISS